MGKTPFFFSGPDDDDDHQDDLTPDELTAVIIKMYLPAANAKSADELISHADIVESIRNALQNINSKAVYDAMTNIGFETKTIEGTIYWLVLYA